MNRHFHEAKCWKRYEPCGEHHAHSYDCGGGVLAPECPDYRRSLHFEVECQLARARERIRCAAEVAWDWGDHDLEKRLRKMQAELTVFREAPLTTARSASSPPAEAT